MKKLKLRIAKFNKRLVVEQLELEGEFKETAHVRVFGSLFMRKAGIDLKEDGCEGSFNFAYFEKNEKRRARRGYFAADSRGFRDGGGRGTLHSHPPRGGQRQLLKPRVPCEDSARRRACPLRGCAPRGILDSAHCCLQRGCFVPLTGGCQ